jgi:hypothetical protein
MKSKGLFLALMGLVGLSVFGSKKTDTTTQNTTAPSTMPPFYDPNNLPAISPNRSDYYGTVTLGYSPGGNSTNNKLSLGIDSMPIFDLSQNQMTGDPTGQTAAANQVQLAGDAARLKAGVTPMTGGYDVDLILAADSEYQKAVAYKVSLDALETQRLNAYRDLTPVDYLTWRMSNLGY